jgi:excinuclease ABC subunit A
LAGKVEIKPSSAHRSSSGKSLIIHGVREHNLKNIDVKVPLGKLICITGVSGSGKSTLVTDILSTALARHFYKAKRVPGKHKDILGLEHLSRAITVDQSPIGRSPRSNPATYTGVFAHIRDFFAQLPEAKIRGYDKGHFSFNTKRGRCSACAGEGAIKAGMHFLPEVYLRCEECQGKHYRNDILEVHFKEKNIADILEMSVNEALDYLGEMIPETQKYLRTLQKVGLGYLKLGQPATNLSGGEAQRLKLASELYKDETANKRALGRTLYILDEPTVGLHFEDIRRLLLILEDLVSRGNTVIVVEHNLEVIKSADWVIDLGPEGGEKGGYLVACGTPREVALVKESYTGLCLKKVFS